MIPLLQSRALTFWRSPIVILLARAYAETSVTARLFNLEMTGDAP